jgi:hypothetical protein
MKMVHLDSAETCVHAGTKHALTSQVNECGCLLTSFQLLATQLLLSNQLVTKL